MCDWTGWLESGIWEHVWSCGCGVEVGGDVLEGEVRGDGLGWEGFVGWEGGGHFGCIVVAIFIFLRIV